MRELLLKNMHSKDKKRSELFLSEHFEKDGIIQEIEKKTVYKVRDILEFTVPADLDKFLDQKRHDDAGVQRYIIKSRSQKTGMRKFIYKVIGEQYVVLKDRIFVLRVSQSLKKIVIDKSKSEQPTGAES